VLPDVAGDALGLARGLAEPLPRLAEHLHQILLGACSNRSPQILQRSAQALAIKFSPRTRAEAAKEQDARRYVGGVVDD
jgi:hypothetical protein